MIRTINFTNTIYVDDDDLLIEDIEERRCVCIRRVKDELMVYARGVDGVVSFFITQKMAKELVEKLGSMIDE